MNRITPVLALAGLLFLNGCLKEEGEGGTCSITGKVYAYDYNAEMTVLRSQYYAPDEDVYIIYGLDSVPSDRVQTGPTGIYRFDYLRPGTYTVYVMSKNVVTKLPPDYAVKKTVQILGNNQVVQVEDIEINK
jgi:hypothetical protein